MSREEALKCAVGYLRMALKGEGNFFFLKSWEAQQDDPHLIQVNIHKILAGYSLHDDESINTDYLCAYLREIRCYLPKDGRWKWEFIYDYAKTDAEEDIREKGETAELNEALTSSDLETVLSDPSKFFIVTSSRVTDKMISITGRHRPHFYRQCLLLDTKELGDPAAHRAIMEISSAYVGNGKPVPNPFRAYAGSVMEGKTKQPTRKGPSPYKNFFIDVRYAHLTDFLSQRFNVPLYECFRIIAEAGMKLHFNTSYEVVTKAYYRHKDKKDRISKIIKQSRV